MTLYRIRMETEFFVECDGEPDASDYLRDVVMDGNFEDTVTEIKAGNAVQQVGCSGWAGNDLIYGDGDCTLDAALAKNGLPSRDELVAKWKERLTR